MNTELLEALKAGATSFEFTKKDGTVRKMNGTLNYDLIDPSDRPSGNDTRKENLDVQVVYDLDVKGWRSFRWDSLVA